VGLDTYYFWELGEPREGKVNPISRKTLSRLTKVFFGGLVYEMSPS